LTIARSIGSVVVSWSITATNFDLESATSLSPPNWKKVDGQPFEFGDKKIISVSIGDGNLFFRLHRP
jgi:hypothetical protein